MDTRARTITDEHIAPSGAGLLPAPSRFFSISLKRPGGMHREPGSSICSYLQLVPPEQMPRLLQHDFGLHEGGKRINLFLELL